MNPNFVSTDLHELKSITEALVNLLIEEIEFAKESLASTKSTLNQLHHTLDQKKSFLSFIQNSISRSEQPLHQELKTINTKIQSYKSLVSYTQNLIEAYTLSLIPIPKTSHPALKTLKKYYKTS